MVISRSRLIEDHKDSSAMSQGSHDMGPRTQLRQLFGITNSYLTNRSYVAHTVLRSCLRLVRARYISALVGGASKLRLGTAGERIFHT